MSHHEEEKKLAGNPAVIDKLFKSRIVWLGQGVDEDISNDICSKLLLLSAEDPEADIYFYINSPGGSVTAGLAIADIMQLIPNRVITYAFGMAASMGQFLLTVGDVRFAGPNLRVLLHQPSGGIGGNVVSHRTEAKLITSMKNQLAAITAERTGKTVEEVNRDGDRDAWYDAEEALEYGFVDHILYNIEDIPKLADEVSAVKGRKIKTAKKGSN